MLATLLNDGRGSDAINWGTSSNSNNSNTSVNLDTIEALYLKGSANDGVSRADLITASAVAAEFNAEFDIKVSNGETTLLAINDNTAGSNLTSVWLYTETGGNEIQAPELQLIGTVMADSALLSSSFSFI
jgi:hypothetical protein